MLFFEEVLGVRSLLGLSIAQEHEQPSLDLFIRGSSNDADVEALGRRRDTSFDVYFPVFVAIAIAAEDQSLASKLVGSEGKSKDGLLLWSIVLPHPELANGLPFGSGGNRVRRSKSSRQSVKYAATWRLAGAWMVCGVSGPFADLVGSFAGEEGLHRTVGSRSGASTFPSA